MKTLSSSTRPFSASRSALCAPLFALAILVLALPSVQAASLYHSGAAGAMTWADSSGSSLWSTASGSGYTATWTSGSDAVFEGTAGAVTIGSGGATAHNINFNTTGYTLSGADTLTLNGTTPTITLGSGLSATIGNNTATVIAGSAGLTKTGAGTLTLNSSAVSTFTGGLAANSGTLTLDYGYYNGNELLNNGNALTLRGGILSLLGNNTAGAANSQTFASTTLNSGYSRITLVKGASATSVTLNLGQVTVNTGGVLLFSPNTSWTATASTTEKVFVTSGGSITVPGSGVAWTRAGIMTGSRWVQVNSSGQLVYPPSSSALTATSADSTKVYSISSGDITFSTLTASSYGLLLNPSATRTVTIPNDGTYTLNGIIGMNSAAASEIKATGTGKVVIGAERDFVINLATSAGLTISAPIDNNSGGASSLTVNGPGSGALTLSNANTYSGGTTLSAGTLNFGNTGALGTGTFTINGGTLGSSGGAINSITNAVVWNGSFANNNVNSLYFSGPVTMNADITVNNGTSTLNLFVNGPITGSHSLTKQGSGPFLLGGNNSFNGGVTVSAGTLFINHSNALGSGALTILGGLLNTLSGTTVVNGNTQNWNGNFTFTGNNPLNLGTGPVTMSASRIVTVTANTLTVGGVIGGSGFGLTKAGAGTLALTGVNTYSGDTLVSAGTLKLGTTGSIANSPNLTLASGATLDVSTLTTALTLVSSQTLKASATGGNTTGSITNSSGKGLTLSAGGLAFTAYGGGSTAPLTVTGTTGGTLDMNGAPVAITTTAALGVGSYPLVAKGGSATVTGTPGTLTVDGGVAPAGWSVVVSSGQLVLTITPASSATVVTSAPNPSLPGADVTFTATVSSGAGTPTGTVLFKTNGVALCDPVGLAGGVAVLITNSLPHGSNTLTAEYISNGNFLASTGSVVQVVNTPPVASDIPVGTRTGEPTPVQIIGGKFAPTDADHDPLTVTAVGSAANGTVTTDGTSVTYTSANTFVGTNTFTYTVSDLYGGAATRIVTVMVAANGVGFNLVSGPTLVEGGGGAYQIVYRGIPYYHYALEKAPNLTRPIIWEPVVTNQAGWTGELIFQFMPVGESGVFRTRYVP